VAYNDVLHFTVIRFPTSCTAGFLGRNGTSTSRRLFLRVVFPVMLTVELHKPRAAGREGLRSRQPGAHGCLHPLLPLFQAERESSRFFSSLVSPAALCRAPRIRRSTPLPSTALCPVTSCGLEGFPTLGGADLRAYVLPRPTLWTALPPRGRRFAHPAVTNRQLWGQWDPTLQIRNKLVFRASRLLHASSPPSPRKPQCSMRCRQGRVAPDAIFFPHSVLFP